MIKIDLITGFLGSGKTTFIKEYVRYLLGKGEKICILENDYGAINVDMMLLGDLRSENCDVEMLVCGGDADCHKRRYKTKLISMGMLGYTRVIIEPSGIYDVDEFFDTLYEEPLDRWYEIGNVITIVDSGLEDDLSKESDYILASQAACAGTILLSRVDLLRKKDNSDVSEDYRSKVVNHLNKALSDIHCNRKIDDIVMEGPWEELKEADFEKIRNSGYVHASYEKLPIDREDGYKSLFYMKMHLTKADILDRVRRIFADKTTGNVIRIKGFMEISENKWIEINATEKELNVTESDKGQDVIIVIGEKMNKEVISSYFPEGVSV
ncbi:MAG: GTP-binding protein [Butyrivibrio sp.]|nr:GTP-binding protein [Butyrivibrio sp.]